MPEEREPGSRRFVGVAVHGRRGGVVFGLLIITLGVLFTLDNLGLAQAGQVLRWWPLVALLYGLARLFGLYCCQNTTVGLIFTLGGGLLLLHELNVLALDPWDLWPVVLVAIGASMVSRAFRRSRGGDRESKSDVPHVPGPRADDDSSTFSVFAVWGGTRRVVSGDFRRGEATAIMGGHEIDLRAARMIGPTATLEVFAWWGSIDLVVPQNWRVAVEAVPFMGSVDDTSWASAGEAAGTLIIRGPVVMSALTIKN